MILSDFEYSMVVCASRAGLLSISRDYRKQFKKGKYQVSSSSSLKKYLVDPRSKGRMTRLLQTHRKATVTRITISYAEEHL